MGTREPLFTVRFIVLMVTLLHFCSKNCYHLAWSAFHRNFINLVIAISEASLAIPAAVKEHISTKLTLFYALLRWRTGVRVFTTNRNNISNDG